RTADGEIVVHHDATGLRMAGVDRRVAECTYAEIQKWNVGERFSFGSLDRAYEAPLFRDVLESFPNTTINVDIKQHEIDVVRDVLKLIQDCGAVERVVLNSFDAEIIKYVRRLGYPGETGVSVQDLMRLRFLPEFLLRRRVIEGDALQLPLHGEGGNGLRRWIGRRVRFDGPVMIRRAHAAGLRLDYWVVNDPDEARRILELGADGVMTDEPDKIRDVFYEFAARSDRNVHK
ncbi:MAG: glycerophosphodiester phosphodiesterase family protein, partial [Leptospirales bacterium]